MTRVLVCAALLAWGSTSHAGGLKGTIALPNEPKIDAQAGLWRVENGQLPVLPRGDLREVLVALEPDEATSKKLETTPVTVELHGLRLDPKIVAIPPGTEVTFKNSDRYTHVLNIAKVAQAEPLPPGQARVKKFPTAGDFAITDDEFPHVQGSVLVLATPFFTTVDDKGAFRIDAPEGKYTLKVFWRNGWAVSRPLNVGSHTTEVAVHIPPPRPEKPIPPVESGK